MIAKPFIGHQTFAARLNARCHVYKNIPKEHKPEIIKN
jgi:hypothetical protein